MIFHYSFVHRYHQERIARPITRLWFQGGVVKVIGGRDAIVGMPFLALRMDVVDGSP